MINRFLNWLHGRRISAKLALLILAMTLPIAMLGGRLFSRNLQEYRQVQAEQAGIEYLVPLHGLLRAIALHRGLSSLAITGDSDALSRLPAQRQLVEQALQSVETAEADHGERLGTSGDWQSLKTDWRRLRDQAPQLRLAESFDRHTALIATGLDISDRAVKQSGLALDPQPPVYHLLNAALNEAPFLIEYLGQVRASMAHRIELNGIPPGEDDTAKPYFSMARAEFTEVSDAIGHALHADAAIAAEASVQLRPIRKAMDALESLIERSTAPSSTPAAQAIDPHEIFASASDAIDAASTFQLAILEQVKTLLSKRGANAGRELVVGTVLPVAMLLVALILAHLINTGIARHTHQVKDSIHALIRGDFSSAINTPTRNEFGDMLNALNDMRLEFLRLLSIEAEQRMDLNQEIAQRREAESELRRMVAAIEHAGDPIMIVSTDKHILYANPAFERLMGVPYGTAAGLPTEHFGFSAESARHHASIRQAFTNREPWHGQISIEHSEQRTKSFDTSVSPIINPDGSISHHVCVLRDITQQLSLEKQLARAQKLEAVGQLAAGIAHEINTPVQYVGDNIHFVKDAFTEVDTLISRLQTLAATVPDLDAILRAADLEFLREEVPKALDQSADGCQRIATIVKAMKEFSHPAQDKTPVDLNRAIESTITVATNEWKYVADLVTDFDIDLPHVSCMPGEFNQVILNMLVNAAHAIGDVVGDGSRGKGTLTVCTRRAGEFAEVRISDTGTGISPEVREKIFDPFFTTKAVGRGTGQGLAIAYDVIVNKHGGSIALDSEVGRGSTFIIRIPIAPAIDPAIEPSIEPAVAGPDAEDRSAA